MWTALGLYALGPKRRSKRSRTWKRKNKDDRYVIIPEETFLGDPQYLPALQEIRIQEESDEASISVSHKEEGKEYAQFTYSMGGNLQLYDEHIALSSPRRKIQKPYCSPKRWKNHLEYSPTQSLNCTDSLELESMDISPKTQPDTDVNDSLVSQEENSAKLGSQNFELRTSLEDLKISNIVDSEGARSKGVSLHEAISKIVDSRDVHNSKADGSKQKQYVKRSRTEGRLGNKNRDYSPIRPRAQIVDEPRKPQDCAPDWGKAGSLTEKHGSKVEESQNEGYEEGEGTNRGLYNDQRHRYDRTLLYVNEQRETLQNGDYSEFNIDLSDLSSDVFTDSELPTSAPLPRPRESKGNTDFYPDSPTSEYTFSKTPCSSRKNSVESYLSGADSLSDLDFKQEITQVPSESLDNAKKKRTSTGVIASRVKMSASNTRKPGVKNVKAKVGSKNNASVKPRGAPTEKIEITKVVYDRKAKAKVNSFQNIHHVPGGGNARVFSAKLTHLKNVEPRTDTHGIETYSHLPSEFQEIARRLAKQDKQLRDNSGSTSSRSRRSSSGKLSGSSVNLSASTTSLASAESTKRSSRRPTNRTPSIRSRPSTPSLSRSHPATYVTPYDSRSRPSSRPSSRPGSRSSSPNSRSRNASPVRGSRSRGSSPVGNRRRSPTANRPKSGTSRSNFGSRTARSTGVADLHHLNSPRSVFQVVPAMNK